MNYKKTSNKLEIILTGDFNLKAVRKISDLLNDRSELDIDLKNARFVNSKAIIFLNKLMHRNPPVVVRLKNPPKIFFKLLQILGLHKKWNLDEIVEP
ncbi:MAG: hypothetical protein U5K72_14645 [Balneolaceae bacterium]|nr:hypothetical protein [Balneolaceae bacterium]